MPQRACLHHTCCDQYNLRPEPLSCENSFSEFLTGTGTSTETEVCVARQQDRPDPAPGKRHGLRIPEPQVRELARAIEDAVPGLAEEGFTVLTLAPDATGTGSLRLV